MYIYVTLCSKCKISVKQHQKRLQLVSTFDVNLHLLKHFNANIFTDRVTNVKTFLSVIVVVIFRITTEHSLYGG